MKTVSSRTVASVVGRPDGWDETWLLYRGHNDTGRHRYRMRWTCLDDGTPLSSPVLGWALVIEAQVASGERDFCACGSCLALVCGWSQGVYAELQARNCGKEK